LREAGDRFLGPVVAVPQHGRAPLNAAAVVVADNEEGRVDGDSEGAVRPYRVHVARVDDGALAVLGDGELVGCLSVDEVGRERARPRPPADLQGALGHRRRPDRTVAPYRRRHARYEFSDVIGARHNDRPAF
jgi:hypothetical protein